MKSSITLTPGRYVWYKSVRTCLKIAEFICQWMREWILMANEWRENGQINSHINHASQYKNESYFPTRALGREFHNPIVIKNQSILKRGFPNCHDGNDLQYPNCKPTQHHLGSDMPLPVTMVIDGTMAIMNHSANYMISMITIPTI